MPLRSAAAGSEIRDFEFDLVYPDGSRRNLIGNATPLFDEAGTTRGSVAAFVDITRRKQAEAELKGSETNLRNALAEKEILLSEIHHRVKNNLAAFISLLSLEGSYEETPAGQALKKDLQNRARTMGLIHETLYRTRQYSEVNMEVYLSTLVRQVVDSFSSAQSIRTVVDVKGVMLDLSRATPTGLIVNELVTNSLKYAFPRGTFECRADRKDPCTITIRLTKENGEFFLNVSDNGIGMPAGFDIKTTQTLGLKLVNFLARHQLRAKIEVHSDKGMEFVFRFKE
jgi:two-component sensor histidine kinase